MFEKLICFFKGHDFRNENVVKTFGYGNWMKKCKN